MRSHDLAVILASAEINILQQRVERWRLQANSRDYSWCCSQQHQVEAGAVTTDSSGQSTLLIAGKR